MKKLLAIVITLSMVFTMGLALTHATEDQATSFVDAVTADTEQGPVWYYLFDDGDGYEELNYTPDWGDNWQYSAQPLVDDVYFSIFDQEGFRAWAGTYGDLNVKIIVGWEAYQDGTVDIAEWDYTAYEYNDSDMTNVVADGVVTILHGTTEVFSATTTTTAADNVFAGDQVEVVEGDMIYFIMDGENSTNATFSLDTLAVSYAGETPEPVDEEEPGDALPIIAVLASAMTAAGALTLKRRK